MLRRDGGHRSPRSHFRRRRTFYARSTADGIPYWAIARLHAHDCSRPRSCKRAFRYGRRNVVPVLRHRAISRLQAIAEKTRTDRRSGGSRVGTGSSQARRSDDGHSEPDDRGARIWVTSRERSTQSTLPVQAQCRSRRPISGGSTIWRKRASIPSGCISKRSPRPFAAGSCPAKPKVSVETRIALRSTSVPFASSGRGQGLDLRSRGAWVTRGTRS